jgi:predicted DsbA family dithiol-disulfide isomerase
VIVEIWSDVACPWCYIGKRRFERARAEFDGSDDVAVTWRSFQLDPSIPRGVRTNHDRSLANKLGATPEQVAALNERVTTLAAAEGLDYHFERYISVNTFDAHRIEHLAKAHGLGAEMHERLFRGQFVEGAVLDDPDTLVQLAVEVGLPEGDARQVVQSDAYSSDVADDIHEAQVLGINGVPFFVIDRRFGISGAQSSDLIRSTLARARDEAAVPGCG